MKHCIKHHCCSSSFHRHSLYVGLLLIVSLIVYGTTLIFAPVNDFINEFLPGRYFMMNCIRNGIFPFWNPYQSMGMPFFADPQAGTYYLPAWIFAIFGQYTATCWGVEFIFHTFVGATGFYLLSHFFTRHKPSAFLIACCYMLSGFFVGNAQHLSWIIAGAWTPWIIYACLLFFKKPNLKSALLPGIFASLLLTGGYPGFFFALIYFIAIIAIYFVIKYFIEKNFTKLKKIFLFGLITITVGIVLSLPTLISFLELKTHITRGVALSYNSTAEPVTLQSLLSLFFPYTVCSEPSFIHTDITMGSVFMGIFTLIFGAFGIYTHRNKVLWVILALGIVNLLLAFGAALPFHRFAFHYLPFLNLIRIPSLFRLFFIIAFLLISSMGLSTILTRFEQYKKPFFLASICLFLFLSLIAIVLWFNFSNSFSKTNLAQSSLSQKIFMECCIDLILTALGLLIFIPHHRRITLSLSILIIFDLSIHAFLCEPQTVINPSLKNSELSVAMRVNGYPLPHRVTSSEELIHRKSLFMLWQNVGSFQKEVEWDSYNPLVLNNHSQMLQPYYKNNLTVNLPIVFSPKKILFATEPRLFSTDTAYTYDPKKVYSYHDNAVSQKLTQFEPGNITIRTSSKTNCPIIVCQTYYPGWKATLDNGQKLDIQVINTSMISFIAPAGNHIIHLRYQRPLLFGLFILQGATLFMLLVGFILYIKIVKQRKNIYTIN